MACFLSNQIMVVDPDAAQVEDTILVGRGPNAMVFNFGDADDHVTPAPPARRAFVTHFSEMSIGVIDTRDVVYFLSLITFGLLAAFRGLESRRWS